MNVELIRTLTRDLQFIAKMIALSAEKNDKQAVARYTQSAGNLLNKITEEMMK